MLGVVNPATIPEVAMANGSKPLRAVSGPGHRVGTQRYKLYRDAWAHLNKASAQGYYLEAIALLESLLTDRMESRATYLTGSNTGFRTLGALLSIFQSVEKDPHFLQVLRKIDTWRVHRNDALHSMAKFEMGAVVSWAKKVTKLPRVVEEGRELLQAYNTLDIAERHKANKRAATEPSAFWP